MSVKFPFEWRNFQPISSYQYWENLPKSFLFPSFHPVQNAFEMITIYKPGTNVPGWIGQAFLVLFSLLLLPHTNEIYKTQTNQKAAAPFTMFCLFPVFSIFLRKQSAPSFFNNQNRHHCEHFKIGKKNISRQNICLEVAIPCKWRISA